MKNTRGKGKIKEKKSQRLKYMIKQKTKQTKQNK